MNRWHPLLHHGAFLMLMPFGKHFGKPLEDLPTSYLLWIVRAACTRDLGLRQAICQVLAARGCPLPEEGVRPAAAIRTPDWVGMIRQWYRGLVLDFHPDRGGSHEAMQVINEGHERLRKLAGL